MLLVNPSRPRLLPHSQVFFWVPITRPGFHLFLAPNLRSLPSSSLFLFPPVLPISACYRNSRRLVPVFSLSLSSSLSFFLLFFPLNFFLTCRTGLLPCPSAISLPLPTVVRKYWVFSGLVFH